MVRSNLKTLHCLHFVSEVHCAIYSEKGHEIRALSHDVFMQYENDFLDLSDLILK